MVAMPAIGASADMRAEKKKVLVLATLGCVVATLLLSTVGRGDLAWAVVLIMLSNTFYSIGESMTAAFLPELAKPDAMGRVSGWAWGFGYLGGMLSLGLSLAYVLSAQARGEPATSFVPVTMLITARPTAWRLWLLLCCCASARWHSLSRLVRVACLVLRLRGNG